jgi:hypothetical protein
VSDHGDDVEVRHAPEAGRYELWAEDTMVGVADYRPVDADTLVFHRE